MTRAMKAADRIQELGLIECGSTALSNLASHQDTSKELNARATDAVIEADGHLCLISVAADGMVKLSIPPFQLHLILVSRSQQQHA